MPAALLAIYMVAQSEVYAFAVQSMLESIYEKNNMVPLYTYSQVLQKYIIFTVLNKSLQSCMYNGFCIASLSHSHPAQLVALSLTGIASRINCCASSFVGVDSLDKTRFGFSLGRPSFQKLLLLLLPPIHLRPSSNLSMCGKKQARGWCIWQIDQLL